MTHHIVVGGHLTRIDDVVADVLAARSQGLLGAALEYIQEGQNFICFTGGGSVLLQQSLRQLVAPTRTEGQYLFVPVELSPTLNALGGYILAQAAAQKVIAAPAPGLSVAPVVLNGSRG
jgi:hypothetical protein